MKLKVLKVKSYKIKFNVDFASMFTAKLQDKEITPTKEKQLIKADNDYDGLNQVLINEIPIEYVIPTGTKEIANNGVYDVNNYESVNVNVEYQINLQQKDVVPNETMQEIIPDVEYDGLEKVNVMPIPQDYVIPTGTIEINTNGLTNVRDYENANINIVNEINLQNKNVIPNKELQEITADTNYDGLEKVSVQPIPSEYIIPSGEINITENGQYDVTEKASVKVQIENSGGNTENTSDLDEYFNTNMKVNTFTQTTWYSTAYNAKYLLNSDLTKALVCDDNNNVLFVDKSEVNNYHSLWRTISSSSSYQILNVDLNLYLRNNNGTLILSDTVTNWNDSSNKIQSRAGRNTYYIYNNNGVANLTTNANNGIVFTGGILKEYATDEDVNKFVSNLYFKKLPDINVPNSITTLDYFCADTKLNLIPKVICENNVTSMSNMYSSCNLTKEIDVSGLNSENVENMYRMFANCSLLENLNLTYLRTDNVLDMSYMFNSCENLKLLDITGLNTSRLQNTEYMFYGCSSLEDLDLWNIDTSNVKDIVSMFQNCYKLTNLNIGNCVIQDITSMQNVFNGCKALIELDLSKFETSYVSSFQNCFADCQALTYINLSSFLTNEATTFYRMFYNCENLVELDLSSFETMNVTNMYQMFYGCISLQRLDIRNFDFSNVTNSSNMFGNITTTYVPADCLIIVKDETAKSWLATNFSRLTNVKTIEEYEA